MPPGSLSGTTPALAISRATITLVQNSPAPPAGQAAVFAGTQTTITVQGKPVASASTYTTFATFDVQVGPSSGTNPRTPLLLSAPAGEISVAVPRSTTVAESYTNHSFSLSLLNSSGAPLFVPNCVTGQTSID